MFFERAEVSRLAIDAVPLVHQVKTNVSSRPRSRERTCRDAIGSEGACTLMRRKVMTGLKQGKGKARAVPMPANPRKGESGMKTQHRFKQWTLGLAAFSMAGIMGVSSAQGQSVTYTFDPDFDSGTLLNVNHDAPNHDQLQLNATTTPFPFVNIAVSNRGTVVRIDVNTGAIIGEYSTNPDAGVSSFPNPSRTTVDQFGNVWVGNRDEDTIINGVHHGSISVVESDQQRAFR